MTMKPYKTVTLSIYTVSIKITRTGALSRYRNGTCAAELMVSRTNQLPYRQEQNNRTYTDE
jgi:hypothetical protein